MSQNEFDAYVMDGSQYQEGHPTYHAFIQREKKASYIVVCYKNTQEILWKGCNNYILIEATDDEKQKLKDAGYRMIGL